MNRIVFSSSVLAALLLGAAASAPATRADEQAAGEALTSPGPSRKVLVIARVEQQDKRRAMEQAAGVELKDRGVEALIGSDVLVDADFASEEALKTKAISLGVDGLLGFTVLSVQDVVKQSHSSVSFGIGVGGGSYGGGGAFGMGVSTTVPLGGTTTERKAQIRARFYNRETGPAWEKVYTKTLGGDLEWLVKSLASDSVKAIKKKKLIATK